MITRAVCRVLVGREEELSTLEDALLAAYRGEGSVVVISATPASATAGPAPS